MRARQFARDLRVHVVVMTAALAIAFGVAGHAGLAGMALGLSATTFSLLALWGVVRLTGHAQGASHPKIGTAIVLLAFCVKVPLFLWMGGQAKRIEGPAPTCFLLGLGLVYCLMVAWALAQS